MIETPGYNTKIRSTLRGTRLAEERYCPDEDRLLGDLPDLCLLMSQGAGMRCCGAEGVLKEDGQGAVGMLLWLLGTN